MADPDSRTGKSRARKVSWLVLALIPVVALLGLLALRGPEDEGIEDTAAQSESPAAPSAPSAPITSDWPTLRGNAGRTGAVPGTGPAANPAVTWRFSPRSDIPMQGQPIVVGDTVYLPGSDFPGGLNALDAVTGEERWHASVGFFTDMENGGGGALIAADETTIYVAGTEGEAQCDCMPPAALYALDSATGQERWRHSDGTELNQSVPVVVDGVVFQAIDDYEGGAVRAFDAATGTVLWSTAGDGPQFQGLPVAVADGTVYAYARSWETNQGFLFALDAATGAERWRATVSEAVELGPVASGDTVFAAISDPFANPTRTNITAFDVATGTPRWNVDLQNEIPAWPVVWNDTVFVTASAIDYAAGESDAELIALDAATGAERWRLDDVGSPTIGGDVLYAGSGRGIVALDAATGAEIWHVPGTEGYGGVVVGNGMLFAFGQGGVIAIAGTTGETVPAGPAAQAGTSPIAPVPTGAAAEAPVSVALTWLAGGQAAPGGCLHIHPDTTSDPMEIPDYTPDGDPLVAVCDAGDDPSGAEDGVLRFELPPGRYLAVPQPSTPFGPNCGPAYPRPFQVTAADIGRGLALDLRINCEPGGEPIDEPIPPDGFVDEEYVEEVVEPIPEDGYVDPEHEEFIDEPDVIIDESGEEVINYGQAPTPSGETAPVTVTILLEEPGGAEASAVDGNVCVMARIVGRFDAPPASVCDGEPGDGDASSNVIALLLSAGSSYEIDVIPGSVPEGSVVIGIDEEGLRPLTAAGGTATLEIGLRAQPTPPPIDLPGIYIVNPDGSSAVKLTGGDIWATNPVWSPDGSRIAFEAGTTSADGLTGDTDIWTVSADGTNPAILVPVPGYDHRPAWSPDGSKIAFLNGNGGVLFVVGSDGSGLRELTRIWGLGGEDMTVQSFELPPAWSPDGTRIFFTATLEEGTEIWSINVDGTGLTRLTDFGEPAQPVREEIGDSFEFTVISVYCPNLQGPGGFPVDLSADTDTAALEAKGCRRAAEGETSFSLETMTIDDNGSGMGSLAKATTDANGEAVLSGFLHPDAVEHRLTQNAPVMFDMSLDGPPFTGPYVVVNYGQAPPSDPMGPDKAYAPDRSQAAGGPAVSPDGSRIAFFVVTPGDEFTGESIGEGGLYVMNADGTGVTQVSDVVPMPYEPPQWSPDGTKLLFTSWYDDNDEVFVYVVNADGTGLAKLAFESMESPTSTSLPYGGSPAWTPDGRILLIGHDGVSGGIATINADGTGFAIIATPDVDPANPAWSPDGSRIVFESLPPYTGDSGD